MGLEAGSALFAPCPLWFFCLGVVLAVRRDLNSCLHSSKHQNPCVKLLEEAEVAVVQAERAAPATSNDAQ